MPIQTAERFRPFGTTIFAEMSRLAAEHNAVNLSQGFPDFDGPDFVKDAAKRAIDEHQNQYARSAGVPELVTTIARRFAQRTGVAVDPMSQVTATSGCTEAIASTLLGTVNPGDEVILFEPYYDSYRACVAMTGAEARFVTLRPVNGRFTFDPEELARAFSSKTRAILVNTPHNPTGTVFTREELDQIAELCQRHNAIALSDEVYEDLTYGTPHISIASLPGMADRTVTLSSLGKSFSLTGWKVGWAITSDELSAAIRSAHQFVTFSTSTPFQHAASVALQIGEEYISELRAMYLRNRDYLGEALAEIGFDVIVPQGTYFILAEHSRVSERLGVKNDVELAIKLTSDIGVAAIPPSVFCATEGHCSNYLRFAFCKQKATLDEAIRRLRKIGS
ncbi:MAG: aminotransferase class I/II-fold pyridoxal phosphate-dependent enzyme [Phycisphaerales bacterium]|nr:aminotransferase class I/II-fold pyridoxal phosphate-dependent enzyme [Phycisphaerales bacterium]MCB9836760.1 aminotransferase class I/II-fold pyridoxal phosphate-dependent enzyme [Phycisphaera sp.]